jgi:hypothetical protein
MSGEEQHRVLRRYLLGELPEAERSRLAEQYFIDKELFDELLDVENELLDQYARGELQPEETRNFRDYLTSLPDGHTKLATAYVLNEARNQIRIASPTRHSEEGQASAIAAQVLPSRWEILRASLFGRGHFLQYAAVVISLLCGLAYLIVSQRALRREVEQLRVERTQAQQEKINSAQQVRIAQDNEAALRDRNLQLERELAQLEKRSNQQRDDRDGPTMALLILTPALRSGNTPDSLTISPPTKTVLFVMPIPKDEQITDYTAVLRTTRGRLVLTKERLSAETSEQRGKTVSFSLLASQLTQSNYKLTLHGKTADRVEIAQDFYFNVARR